MESWNFEAAAAGCSQAQASKACAMSQACTPHNFALPHSTDPHRLAQCPSPHSPSPPATMHLLGVLPGSQQVLNVLGHGIHHLLVGCVTGVADPAEGAGDRLSPVTGNESEAGPKEGGMGEGNGLERM